MGKPRTAMSRIYRTLAVVGSVTLTVIPPHSARADAIAEVTLDKSGPDQNLPLRTSFYLKGSADGIEKISVVFVRYSRGVWGIPTTGYNCADIADAFPNPDAKSALFTSNGSNFRKVKDVWTGPLAPIAPPDLNRDKRRSKVFGSVSDAPILVAGPWKREASTDKDFKILVSNPSFFQAGARYCMIAYKQTKKDRTNEINRILARYGVGSQKCGIKPTDQARKDCWQKALDEAADTISKTIGDEFAKAWFANALAQTSDLTDSYARAQAASGYLALWLQIAQAFEPDKLADISKDPLALTVARTLEHEFKLRGTVRQDAVRFYNDSGSIEANFLGILGNYAGVRVAKSLADPKSQFSITVDLDKILVPGAKITLRDLVASGAHQFKYGDDWILADQLFTQKLGPSLIRGLKDKDTLLAFAEKLNAWHELLRLLDADSMLTNNIRTWLVGTKSNRYNDGLVFRGCTTMGLTPPDDVKCATGGALGFYGFASQDNSPFSVLRTAVLDQIRALENLAGLPAYAQSLTVSPFTAGAVPLQVDLTQKDFVTTYLTPTVGTARFLSTKEPFSIPYASVQVFLFPNPIDEPMWTNGLADFGRVFAFEVGMAAQTGSFGPGNRYSGAGGIPPVFAGLVLHPIPYVTTSFGRSLLNVRSGPLPQQTPELVGSWYWGLSVQANIPDLIRTISNGGTNSTATQAAKEN